MKEVRHKRYAGPFEKIPFNNYMQSLIGLVPKAGNQTRLIFYLSYDFGPNSKSFNYHTSEDKCSVQYRDLDHAVHNCLRLMKSNKELTIWLGITDLQSAFRVLPGKPYHWRFLMMKAQHPKTEQTYYFTDKCIPFGASISCSLYTEFSNALAHILSYYTNATYKVTNYLDNFLFIESSQHMCDYLVSTFIELCKHLGVPVAEEKVIWASTSLKFFRVILNGIGKFLQVPQDKRNKALNMLVRLQSKRTITVKEVQELTGLLNFLAKVIIPGRTFTRRMYIKISSKTKKLQQHHHITIDQEFRSDAAIWASFLLKSEEKPHTLCHPFIDLNLQLQATEIDLYTDSSANAVLGFGGIYLDHWFFGQWESGFIKNKNPRIQYLELYAVCMAVFIWIRDFANYRLILHCDNSAVIQMINLSTSGCKHCMVLIRKLMILCLQHNTRVFAEHVEGSKNGLSDSLSHLQFKRFLKLAKEAKKTMRTLPEVLSDQIWPVSKIWLN